MLTVMKFGGSSLSTVERVANVASIIASGVNDDDRVVAVVSARGKTTDELTKVRDSITAVSVPRESDVLLSTGEQVSMSLLAMKLNEMGHDAVSLCGWQAGIRTNDRYGSASITEIDTSRVLRELEAGRIVIVAGFQGVSPNQDITTLGRGGSDTTAIALAAALHADSCHIYTDVSGVFSANPNVAIDAIKHREISYDEMIEMSTLGAQVLHNRSVIMAKNADVSFEVRSSLTNDEGTKVHRLAPEKTVSGVVCDDHISMVTVSGIDSGASTCRLFELLADNGIPVDVIIRSQQMYNGKGMVSFSVSDTVCIRVVDMLNEMKDELEHDMLMVESGLAKLSAVGSGLADSCTVASIMLSELNKIDIHPRYITTGEIRISVIIPSSKADMAHIILNKRFFGEE